jgi:recombination protein RecR
MSALDKLIEHFEKFPGVGARQAKRFAYHILTMRPGDSDELAHLIATLKTDVVQCPSCQRFFSTSRTHTTLCQICSDTNRDQHKLMVVAQDSDIASVEKSGVYDGLYFVLGGTVPLLHSEEVKQLRGALLKATVEARLPAGLSEVILGFAVNPDGENTGRYVEAIINQIEESKRTSLTVSQLGRGLSTGSELEYADPETIKNALRNRG